MSLAFLANLASVAGGVVGIVSLFFQVLPFFRQKGQFETLHDALKLIRSPEIERTHSVYGSENDGLEQIRWLDRGHLIFVPLRRRVIRRAIIAALGLLAIVATIPLNIPNVNGVQTTNDNLEWPDLVTIVVAAALPRFSAVKRWLVGEAEQRFMENLIDLEESFYNRDVIPRIEIFNAIFDQKYGHVRGSARKELHIVSELDAMRVRLDRVESLASAARPPAGAATANNTHPASTDGTTDDRAATARIPVTDSGSIPNEPPRSPE